MNDKLSDVEMEENNGVAPFSLLPEGCISDVLSRTSPRDACRAAAISWGFRSAVDSDAVWERFLPPDYREIIAKSATPLVYATKKQLYFLLCDSPILFDGGKLSFTLNKWNGKKCYMLPARELYIAWKDTPQYWSWISLPESRFSEVAQLLSVCWLDIRCKIGTRILSSKTTYAAYLVFKLTEHSYGLDFVAKTLVRFSDREEVTEGEQVTEEETSTVYLIPQLVNPGRRYLRRQERDPNGRLPQKRMDGWMEIEVGEFFNDQGDDGYVEMRFMEIKQLNSKSGLIVEGIEVRPKLEA